MENLETYRLAIREHQLFSPIQKAKCVFKNECNIVVFKTNPCTESRTKKWQHEDNL